MSIIKKKNQNKPANKKQENACTLTQNLGNFNLILLNFRFAYEDFSLSLSSQEAMQSEGRGGKGSLEPSMTNRQATYEAVLLSKKISGVHCLL